MNTVAIQAQREVWQRAMQQLGERENERSDAIRKHSELVEKARVRAADEEAALDKLIADAKEELDANKKLPATPATAEELAAIEHGEVFGQPADADLEAVAPLAPGDDAGAAFDELTGGSVGEPTRVNRVTTYPGVGHIVR